VCYHRVPAQAGRPVTFEEVHVPNIKQQKKRMRTAAEARLRNRQTKSVIRTLFKRLETSVAEQDRETAEAVARQLTSSIDKAATKGVIHKNNAAHKKARVAHISSGLSA
jgi:small subunit ribosomal protein S20